MAIRWSRVELYLSVLTCKGLFATLRERFQYVPTPRVPSAGDTPVAGASVEHREPTRPGREDSLGLPRYYDYAGAVHVHSTYSDGAGTVQEIADAANHAGLDFVVLCDHASLEARRDGLDGWHGRTLIVVGTELTTDTGHLLALNVPDSILPASNNASEAQEQIVRQGGIGFIALPCDLKDHWDDFTLRNPLIGLEVFNLSAIARTKINLPTMALVWSRYRAGNPHDAFHWVAARPARELKLWDSLICDSRVDDNESYRPVVGIGSIDAHGIMKFAGRSYNVPTYAEVFRTLRTHILLAEPLSGGDAVNHVEPGNVRDIDLAAVHSAIAKGHSYFAYDNYADSTGFLFECVTPNSRALMGESIPAGTGQPIFANRIVVRAPKTRSFIRLYRNGKLVAVARGGTLQYIAQQSGAYRAEVFLYRHRIGNMCLNAKPWIFSNPIYIQPPAIDRVSARLREANAAHRSA